MKLDIIKERKNLEELTLMGIIICQQCNEVVSFYAEEKVTKRYGICSNCNGKHKKSK